MYCETCGKENNQFVSRCSYCGGKLVKEKPTNPEPAYKKMEAKIKEDKIKKEQSYYNIDMDSDIPEYGPVEYYRHYTKELSSGEIKSYKPRYKHYIDL